MDISTGSSRARSSSQEVASYQPVAQQQPSGQFAGLSACSVTDADFKPFLSIKNHDSPFAQRITQAESFYKEKSEKLHKEWKIVITEKIHGTNFSFTTRNSESGSENGADQDAKVRYGFRSGFITQQDRDSDRHKFSQTAPKYDQMILDYHKKFCPEGALLQVYGELFGPNVTYGRLTIKYPEDGFAAFAASMDGRLVDCLQFHERAKEVGLPVVPLIKVTNSLLEALSFNTEELVSAYSKPDGQSLPAEGVVIQPDYSQSARREDKGEGASLIIFKKKSSAYAEHSVRAKKNTEQSGSAYEHIRKEGENLIVTTRLISLKSNGKITREEFEKSQGQPNKNVFFKKVRQLLVEDAIDELKRNQAGSSSEAGSGILFPEGKGKEEKKLKRELVKFADANVSDDQIKDIFKPV